MKRLAFAIFVIAIIISAIYLKDDATRFVEKVKKDAKIYNISNLSNKLMEGDIIFQVSKSSQSKAIQLATGSKYSHMGIIFKSNSGFYVFEAVQPVKFTTLNKWINRGVNKHYVVKRLKNADELLTKEMLTAMKKIGEKFKGKNYDIYFGWSDDKIYCSELIWKIYKHSIGIEIGELEKLSDFDLSSEIVKQKLKERYGDKIPMSEKVISPTSMFNSDKIYTIIEN